VKGYVAIGGAVLPFTTAGNKLGTPIDDWQNPSLITLTPNGGTAYVTNATQFNLYLQAINLASGKLGPKISMPSFPGPVAFTPNGKEGYELNEQIPYGVTPFSTATNKAGPQIVVGNDPDAILANPNGKVVYVTAVTSDQVTPINTATNKPGKPFMVGEEPDALALTPNGQTLYVANAGNDPSLDGTVQAINLATGKVGPPITVGQDPAGLLVTPNGKTVYVANYDSGTVLPVSVATGKVGTAIMACASTSGLTCHPQNLSLTPNGKTIFVTNGAPEATTITSITVATNKAKVITVGPSPTYLAITPNGSTVYVSTTGQEDLVPVSAATGKAGQPIALSSFPGSIVVAPAPLKVVTASLKAGKVGKSYDVKLAAAGGVGTYRWSHTGSLPKGLKLSTSGVISGKPAKTGTTTFTVQVSDPGGATAKAKLKIKVT
jgi:YVTN family beta-propeller protein